MILFAVIPFYFVRASNEFAVGELATVAPGASGELKKGVIPGIHCEGGGIV